MHPTPISPHSCSKVCVSSLCLCLYFCFVNRFICIIFLDSTYMIFVNLFVFLFLTYFTRSDSLRSLLAHFLTLIALLFMDKSLYLLLARVFLWICTAIFLLLSDFTLGVKMQLVWQNNESFRLWNPLCLCLASLLFFSLYFIQKDKEKGIFFSNSLSSPRFGCFW